jgi:DNA-binding IclR family transcriptional regulator
VQAIGGAAAGGAQSIDRAATLLLLVGRAGPFGARLSELVEQCDLAKPTVRRMLLALVRAGLLDQDPETRRYYIGPEIYVLGTLAGIRFGIHPISLRSLVRLSQETGDTAFLSVPRGVYSICVHREEGAYPIRIHALHAGDRHPLGVGAGSLALLSALPDHEVEEVLAANADILADNYPQHQPKILRAMVQEARAKGYALNPGMLLPGSWGIGVAIRGEDGQPIGALSIAAIESRLGKDRQQKLAELLTKEARSIETRLREVSGMETLPRRKS